MTGRPGRRLTNEKKKMQVKQTEKIEEKKARKTNRVSNQGG